MNICKHIGYYLAIIFSIQNTIIAIIWIVFLLLIVSLFIHWNIDHFFTILDYHYF